MNTPGPGTYGLQTVFEKFSRNLMDRGTIGRSQKIEGIPKERLAVPGPGQYNELNATMYISPKKQTVFGSSQRTNFANGNRNPGP